jgi:serine/threonine protein kinase
MREDQFILEDEAKILTYINCNRIPKVKSFGYSGNYMILVMELLGKSLDKIFNEIPSKRMSIRCVCNIAYQLMLIFEVIHNNNIIHRDIKPANIAIGFEEDNKSKYIYVLDFGLSKKYRSDTTKRHFSKFFCMFFYVYLYL